MSRMPRTKVFNTNLIMGFVNLSAPLATNHPLLINAHKKLDRYTIIIVKCNQVGLNLDKH